MTTENLKPYKIGIALSGGGARGFAHAGALQAIEELGIKPNVLAGVSAGAIVATLYSANVPPNIIPALFKELKFNDLCDLSVPKDGFFKLDKFKKFIKRTININNIENLYIPTYICATDIEKGEPIAFSSGSIVERVVASCSIPVIFKPVRIDGHYYVDGGVLHNLPAWSIRDNCEILIGINCSPLIEEKYTPTILGMAQRTFDLMARTNAINDASLCDVVVEMTDIARHNIFNLKETNKVYNSGYIATKECLLNCSILKKHIRI